VTGGVHTAQRHDSALKHVTGQAVYIDDMPEPAGTLHAALVLSPIAHGRLQCSYPMFFTERREVSLRGD